MEQNVRLQGSMHPVKFLSRGRDGGLWWPAGLLFILVGLVVGLYVVGDAWESWATFYILTLLAFPISHITLFPVVLRSTDHAKQSELYFISYTLG